MGRNEFNKVLHDSKKKSAKCKDGVVPGSIRKSDFRKTVNCNVKFSKELEIAIRRL